MTSQEREEEVRREQREADAALVRAAGCVCLPLYRDSVWGTSPTLPAHPFTGEILWRDEGLLVRHDPRCPAALAAAILEGKP